jgi:poly-gamma-glutamate biosynthesis protein PgsC/CapC
MPYEVPFIGLLASLLFITLTGLYPGGVIVPSYLVLFLNQPARLAATLAVALLTLLCFRLASQWLILFGTRRFVFMVLVAALWSFVASRAFSSAPPIAREFQVIGWIVPGLMSNAFERQGVALTTASIATVTVASYFLGMVLGTTL